MDEAKGVLFVVALVLGGTILYTVIAGLTRGLMDYMDSKEYPHKAPEDNEGWSWGWPFTLLLLIVYLVGKYLIITPISYIFAKPLVKIYGFCYGLPKFKSNKLPKAKVVTK